MILSISLLAMTLAGQAAAPEAAELRMPAQLETTQTGACPAGEVSLTLRASAHGLEVRDLRAPKTTDAQLKTKVARQLAPIVYVAKIRIFCMDDAAVFEVEGYDAWSGPDARPVSRRFGIGGNNFTPLP